MKKRMKLMFYIALVGAVLLPTSMTAQSLFNYESKTRPQQETGNSGMFGKVGEAKGYDDEGIGNQGFNQVPLGSGVAMLIAAGAGYALLKSKKNKKN